MQHLPIACDALNARTVAIRGVSLYILRVVARKPLHLFPARCWSLGCPGGDNLTRIASWRTRRMARRKRNVSDLPYAAPPLSCAAFFVKVQNGIAAASTAERESRPLRVLIICLKGEDSHHQLLLAAVPVSRLRQNRYCRFRRGFSSWTNGLCSFGSAAMTIFMASGSPFVAAKMTG